MKNWLIYYKLYPSGNWAVDFFGDRIVWMVDQRECKWRFSLQVFSLFALKLWWNP